MGTETKRAVTSTQINLGALRNPLLIGGGAAGVLGLCGALLSMGQAEDWYQKFSASYLVSFCFFMSISLGGLFWVTAMHLTRAGWGICVRRLCEILAMMALPMLVLFLPILIPVVLGWNSSVYSWVNIDNITHARDLVEHKAGYLNSGFFTVRSILYFVIWGLLARFYLKNSVNQDSSRDPNTTLKLQSFSAPGMLLFALTVVFASFDWEMSLDPLWFSTMFPVYFFAGGVLGSLCVLTITSVSLQKSGRLTEDITTEHYHDLGKLTFGFVFFWAYIAFSQYLLIWYANIPEETSWFLYRQEGDWQMASIVLIAGHLIVPFFAIMPRTLRRNKTYMAFASIFILVMCWFDHFWLVMPQFRQEFGVIPADVLCLVGLGGLFVASFAWIAGDKSLIPEGDPRLYESLSYHNV